ncbi:MAG TPA: baseplate J/gp47 family protein [Actinomycetota bacterium]|nr:baseplate J/gp47 family protein [Actinomycetota bacterium]
MSLDLSDYIDLTLNDADPDDLVARALELAQTVLPDWVPRTGNVEVALLEVLAVVAAENVYAINRVPEAVVEALLGLFGITRDAGQPPTADLTFTLSDDAGHAIPAGTSARLILGGDFEPVTFTTDAELVIAPGVDSGTVAATGNRNTIDANGFPAGTILELEDAVAFVDVVELATDVTDGAAPEADIDFLDRGVTQLSRLVSTLVLPEHFTAAALVHTFVARATTIDNFDASAVSGDPGDHAGHVSVYALGADGAMLSAGEKTTLDEDLEAKAMANIAVHIADPTITDVDVTVSVVRDPDYDPADVQAAIEAALETYLDPSNWAWSKVVRRNELISLIDHIEGVEYVQTLDEPAADVVLPGDAALAAAGTFTVTVNDP